MRRFRRRRKKLEDSQAKAQASSTRPPRLAKSTLADRFGEERHIEYDEVVWTARDASTLVKLNLKKLQKTGYITPLSKRNKTKEQFRVVKRPLLANAFLNPDQPDTSNIVMVTSATPGEGKTFTSINLALSIAAEREVKVVLMDGDVIRQGMRRQLGITTKTGYLDVLAGPGMRLSDVLMRTNIPSLAILPCGETREDATELFASSRMSDLLYDLAIAEPDRIVIIDTPPVLASSETTALAMHIGQIVFVIGSGVSPRYRIEEALSHLSVAPVDDIVCVLNKAEEADLGHSYGSYPEYYAQQTFLGRRKRLPTMEDAKSEKRSGRFWRRNKNSD